MAGRIPSVETVRLYYVSMVSPSGLSIHTRINYFLDEISALEAAIRETDARGQNFESFNLKTYEFPATDPLWDLLLSAGPEGFDHITVIAATGINPRGLSARDKNIPSDEARKLVAEKKRHQQPALPPSPTQEEESILFHGGREVNDSAPSVNAQEGDQNMTKSTKGISRMISNIIRSLASSD